MRILFVTPYVPSLVRVRSFSFIKYMGQRHDVSLLALQQVEGEDKHLSILRPYCEHIESVRLPKARSILNCSLALFNGASLQASYCRSDSMRRRLGELLSSGAYDLLHIEHLRGSYLAEAANGVPVIYDSVDCISLLLERTLENSTSLPTRAVLKLELPRTRNCEASLLRQVDKVLVTSRDDQSALERLVPGELPAGHIQVVPCGVHQAYPQGCSEERNPNSIVFSGKMSYHPNVDAVLHFCREVLPIVRAHKPRVTFTIVGSDPPTEIRELACDHIRVTGHVADVRPFLRNAAVAVAPLRYAVGIQQKVIEAMAMDTPVVATSVACRALSVCQGEDLLVADRATAFAAEITRLLDDSQLRDRIGANGRRYVEKNHEWGSIVERLSQMYEQVVATRREFQRPGA